MMYWAPFASSDHAVNDSSVVVGPAFVAVNTQPACSTASCTWLSRDVGVRVEKLACTRGVRAAAALSVAVATAAVPEALSSHARSVVECILYMPARGGEGVLKGAGWPRMLTVRGALKPLRLT